MLGGLGGSIADAGHQNLALESSADSVINTLGLAPVWLLTAKIDEEKNLIYLRGAVPGAPNAYVAIRRAKRG